MHPVDGTVTRIIDGDTFVVTVHGHVLDFFFEWPNVYVRIIGLYAPEKTGETKEAGLLAMARLEELILGKEVTLHSEGKRSFNRVLAEVYLPDGQNVAEIMIREGFGGPNDA